MTGPVVRPGRPSDGRAVAALLYATATGVYDSFAGGAPGATNVLCAAYARRGNNASREVVTVAEADGEVAGAIAAFPVREADRRARRFRRVMLARSAPWRWPAIVRLFRLGAAATPPAPADALYVDALATASPHRRRGVATALLEQAEREARRAGLAAVALDAAADNAPARALYERAGFRVSGRRAAIGALPAIVGYVRAL